MSTRNPVNVHAAKTHFSKLLERAHRGETIVLSKAGKPYARLGPLEAPKRRELGFVRVDLDEKVFAPLSEEETKEWETSPLFPEIRRTAKRPGSRPKKATR